MQERSCGIIGSVVAAAAAATSCSVCSCCGETEFTDDDSKDCGADVDDAAASASAARVGVILFARCVSLVRWPSSPEPGVSAGSAGNDI